MLSLWRVPGKIHRLKAICNEASTRYLSAMSTTFDIVKPRTDENSRQRLGKLRTQERHDLLTPNLLALATRGFVPHLAPDNLQKETNVFAVHAGFEDFAESIPKPPVHYSFPCGPKDSPLKRFIALPKSHLLVLGPRRANVVPSNGANTYTSLNICTSVGYRDLEISSYLEAIAKSRPDVIIAPVDVEFGRTAIGAKRKDKMVERSTAWVRSFEIALKEAESNDYSPVAWVPILPLETEIQGTYLQHLEDVGSSFIQGIVVYNPESTVTVPEAFAHLPLISLTEPQSPQGILRLVALGVDIIAAPFVTAAAEAGVALDFDFPVKVGSKLLALGTDMWAEEHATQIAPLSKDCSCYTCTNHHRAYIQHLLSAKEMLAWVLLQIHNHHVIDRFFGGIRESIAQGTFETDVDAFANTYQHDLPVFQGQGPRIRGYQASSGANAKKLNQTPFKKMAQLASSRYNDDGSLLSNAREKQTEAASTNVIDLDVMDDFNFDSLVSQSEINN